MDKCVICPCCGAPFVGRSCPNCMVCVGKPEDYDPDDFLGEYEEETIE